MLRLTLEKIVEGRFGSLHARVFRVLCTKGALDDKSISDMTLLPIKETRVSVNEMFAGGIVDTIDLPERGLLYYVKIPSLK